MPVKPAFSAKIDDFRSDKGPCQSGNVNQQEPFIASRLPRPEDNAYKDAREHQPAVSGESDIHQGAIRPIPEQTTKTVMKTLARKKKTKNNTMKIDLTILSFKVFKMPLEAITLHPQFKIKSTGRSHW